MERKAQSKKRTTKMTKSLVVKLVPLGVISLNGHGRNAMITTIASICTVKQTRAEDIFNDILSEGDLMDPIRNEEGHPHGDVQLSKTPKGCLFASVLDNSPVPIGHYV